MKRSVSLRLLALTLAACLMLTGCSLFTSRELHDPIKDGQALQAGAEPGGVGCVPREGQLQVFEWL